MNNHPDYDKYKRLAESIAREKGHPEYVFPECGEQHLDARWLNHMLHFKSLKKACKRAEEQNRISHMKSQDLMCQGK